MFADVRRFQGLDGDDADGDKYYGGSMYYGDGKGSGIAVRTWCGYRDCSPYEWRREEEDLEKTLWASATPKGSVGLPNIPVTPVVSSYY